MSTPQAMRHQTSVHTQLLDLPHSFLADVLSRTARDGRGAYASCRQLRAAWFDSLPAFLLQRNGKGSAILAAYGLCPEVFKCSAPYDARIRSERDPNQQGKEAEDRLTECLRLEDANALALLRALRAHGARLRREVLPMASRLGHVLVVRELLFSGLEDMDVRCAVVEALAHARHVGRTLELLGMLMGSRGKQASPKDMRAALGRNANVAVARALVAELGLQETQGAVEFGEALTAALHAENASLVKELLAAGVPPTDKHMQICSARGQVPLLELLLPAAPREVITDSLAWATAAQLGHVDVLRCLAGAANLPPGHDLLQVALGTACNYRQAEAARELCRAGADPMGPRAARHMSPLAVGGAVPTLRALLLPGRHPPEHPVLREALAALSRPAPPPGPGFSRRVRVPALADFARHLFDPVGEGLGLEGFDGAWFGFDDDRDGDGAGPDAGSRRLPDAPVSAGRSEVADVLLAAGADLGSSLMPHVLLHAVDADDADMLAALLRTGRFHPGCAELGAALERAVENGKAACAELLASGVAPGA